MPMTIAMLKILELARGLFMRQSRALLVPGGHLLAPGCRNARRVAADSPPAFINARRKVTAGTEKLFDIHEVSWPV